MKKKTPHSTKKTVDVEFEFEFEFEADAYGTSKLIGERTDDDGEMACKIVSERKKEWLSVERTQIFLADDDKGHALDEKGINNKNTVSKHVT